MRATPHFDFQLGESAEMIRETVARFADEQIAPLAEKIDRVNFDSPNIWEDYEVLQIKFLGEKSLRPQD